MIPHPSYEPGTTDKATDLQAQPRPEDFILIHALLPDGSQHPVRPKLKGDFRSWHSPLEDSLAEDCDRAIFFKCHVIGLFFPVNHHYLDRGANTPWIARVVLKFHSLDDFASHDFEWRKNHRKYFARSKGIDWESHPRVDGVTMFYRTQHIDFGTKLRPHWTAAITVWTKDPAVMTRDFTDAEIVSMFNQKTNVCMEAFRVEKSPGNLLCTRRRIFIKYAQQQELSESDSRAIKESVASDLAPVPDEMFCIERDKAIELQDGRLCAIIEENIERQLFGEESGEHPDRLEDLAPQDSGCGAQDEEDMHWFWGKEYYHRRVFCGFWAVFLVIFVLILIFTAPHSKTRLVLDLNEYRHRSLQRLCDAIQNA